MLGKELICLSEIKRKLERILAELITCVYKSFSQMSAAKYIQRNISIWNLNRVGRVIFHETLSKEQMRKKCFANYLN